MSTQTQTQTRSNALGLRLILNESPRLTERRAQLWLVTQFGAIVDDTFFTAVTLADRMVGEYNRLVAIDPIETMPVVTFPAGYTNAQKEEAIALLKTQDWDFMDARANDSDRQTVYMGRVRNWH